jgi:hypothetical protein
MYGCVRHYHFDAKDSAEIDTMVRDQFLPLIRKAKGFVSYHWIDTGKGEAASLSIFQDKAGADESVRLAADFVAKHASKLVKQKPEVIEGPLVAHS